MFCHKKVKDAYAVANHGVKTRSTFDKNNKKELKAAPKRAFKGAVRNTFKTAGMPPNTAGSAFNIQ